jgi:hypothetical protein
LARSFRKQDGQSVAYGIAAAAAGAEHCFLFEIHEGGMTHGTREHAEYCFNGQFLHPVPV